MTSKPVQAKNDQGNKKGHGIFEKYERCELCNVPVFQNPCHDVRSLSIFKGKGRVLCNKCAATLAKLPAKQALQALNNAAEIYSANKEHNRSICTKASS